MYKESDVVVESGKFWVLKDSKKKAYFVMQAGITHSKSIAAFDLNEDGLSLAMAYFNYQVKRTEKDMTAKHPEYR